MVFIFPNSTTKKLFMIYISNIWPKSGTKRLYFLVRREYVASFCSQYFICFFRLMLQVCLSECCLCFTHMFANVLFRCCICFLVVSSVFRCFCKCFRCMFQVLSVFRHMSQVFYLNISRVDWVLHLPSRLLLPRLDVSSSRRRLGIRRLLPLFLMLVMFETPRGLTWVCETTRKKYCIRTPPGASKPNTIRPTTICEIAW
jgi:hypothetical protein